MKNDFSFEPPLSTISILYLFQKWLKQFPLFESQQSFKPFLFSSKNSFVSSGL